MVPLAKAFEAQGDEVLWATAADTAPRLRSDGFSVADAGLGDRESMAVVFADPEIMALPPEQRPPVMGPRLFGRVRPPRMLADLLPIAREFAPDLIVADTFELASPLVAALLGVRHVTHSFGPLLPAQRLEAAADYAAPLWHEHGLEPRPFGGVYDDIYLDVYPPSLFIGDSGHVPHIQSLRPVEYESGADELLPEWIGASELPLVYVTMGTVFSDLGAITDIVNGVRDLSVQVLVTVGPHWDPAALGEQPPNVHIAKYVPQRQILPHCAMVVSHGGSGTFLASIAAGLPQILVPQGADQFLNAEAGARAGLATVVPPTNLSPQAVHAAAERMLGDGSIHAAVARVADEIERMPSPSAVAQLLRN